MLFALIDTDVIISSLLSHEGAGSFLIKQMRVHKYISNISLEEIKIVSNRLGIGEENVKKTLTQLHIVPLTLPLKEIKSEFKKYTQDENDCHIVAGTQKSKSRFLITYNVKDFKVEKIKKDLDIIILTPGSFLQYMRSLSDI